MCDRKHYEIVVTGKKVSQRSVYDHSVMIQHLEKTLALTTTQLAGLLGVSERGLIHTVSKQTEKKLYRLCQVIRFINARIRQNRSSFLVGLITDGRIFEGREDFDSTSLISYICANPEDKNWKENTDEAMINYGFTGVRL